MFSNAHAIPRVKHELKLASIRLHVHRQKISSNPVDGLFQFTVLKPRLSWTCCTLHPCSKTYYVYRVSLLTSSLVWSYGRHIMWPVLSSLSVCI